MRVCLVYDCLFPHTIGGAERWYRRLAEHLVAGGHEVTYLTLRQWDVGEKPDLIDGACVVTVGPRLGLYTEAGRRRILPPLIFALGVLWHLLRHGRSYEIVHMASFPYFSVLGAAIARLVHKFYLIIDYHEVWSWSYWREYLGLIGGGVGWFIQYLCLKVPQKAFCPARLTERQLHRLRVNGTVTLLEGEYDGPTAKPQLTPASGLVLYAGRHIPEKRVPAAVEGIARAHRQNSQIHGIIIGDGPERPQVLEAIRANGMQDVIECPGFLDQEAFQSAFRRAQCMILPSKREGYGMIVVESSAAGIPSIVVDEPSNAAVALVEHGVNGLISQSASAADLSDAILQIHSAGETMRNSTAEWFTENAERLSIKTSFATIEDHYRSAIRQADR